jgi:hypothetical protein
MISAHDLVALGLAHRERQLAMPAGILQRSDLAIGAAVKDDVLAADLPGSKFAADDLLTPGCGVPRIEREKISQWS